MLFLFMQRGAVILAKVIDEEASSMAGTLACSKQELLLRHEVQSLDLFLEAL